MLTVLIALGYALAIALLLLAVPLRITVIAEPRAEPRLELRISWLFGLVNAPVRPGANGEQEPAPLRAPTTRSAWTLRQMMTFVRSAGGPARVQALLRDLVASLHPCIRAMHIEIGLDDPADTGRAWAMLGPLAAWAAQRYGPIAFQPSFLGPAFLVAGRADLMLVPLQTLGIALRYAASPKTLRALYEARRTSR